jgi:hypothetical protein
VSGPMGAGAAPNLRRFRACPRPTIWPAPHCVAKRKKSRRAPAGAPVSSNKLVEWEGVRPKDLFGRKGRPGCC